MVIELAPPVVNVVRSSKQQLRDLEVTQQRYMARDWVEVQNRLDSYFADVGLQIEQAQAIGKPLSVSALLRTEAYRTATKVARIETVEFNRRRVSEIETTQVQYVNLGQIHAQDAINVNADETRQLVNFFDPRVQEEFAGMAGDGNPLGNLFRTVWPESAEEIENLMKQALLKGLGPRLTAQLLRDNFFVPLNRALNIARTEQLRAYRSASLFGYKTSGIVSGYKRLATHDDRVCPGCLFKEGEFVQSLDSFDEHPQGRCAMVPVVKGVRPPNWQGNEEWFGTLEPENQALILGPGRYDLWKSGRISLADIPMKVRDPVWGDSWVPKPLYKLAKIRNLQ